MNVEKIKILPWNEQSRGAKSLSELLGVKRLRREGSTFVGNSSHIIINWGCSELPENVRPCKIINKVESVRNNSNKLLFFDLMSDGYNSPKVPPWTDDRKEALGWVREGLVVLARTKLKASSGKGIVFLDDINEWIDASLYTVYQKKREEYRIHISFGEIISVQRKVLRKTDDSGNPINPKEIDFRIRNLKNGFIYQQHNITPNKDVLDQAILAYKKSYLDFGAVDVIWNDHDASAFVLEINCAPGIEGSTVEAYAKSFMDNL